MGIFSRDEQDWGWGYTDCSRLKKQIEELQETVNVLTGILRELRTADKIDLADIMETDAYTYTGWSTQKQILEGVEDAVHTDENKKADRQMELNEANNSILKDITDCMADMLATIIFVDDRLTLDEFDALCSQVCTDVNMQKYIRDLVAKHILEYK